MIGKRLFFAIVLISLAFPAFTNAQVVSPRPSPVEYTLPYPGLLPDHPLYFLRALRDSIQKLLVSKPEEKADYYLLQADKAVSASSMLVQKPETHKLAGAVAIESQEYFSEALDSVEEAHTQGFGIQHITQRLIMASKKHQETLIGLQRAVGEEEKEVFDKAIQQAKQLEKKAKALLPEE